MLVRDIQNITQKHMLISYRREYQADALIGFQNREPKPFKIEFSVEMTPIGGNVIRVKMLDELDYPLVPLLQELKERITVLDSSNALPR